MCKLITKKSSSHFDGKDSEKFVDHYSQVYQYSKETTL